MGIANQSLTRRRGASDRRRLRADWRVVLLVADFLQPFDYLAVERFQNGDTRQSVGRRGAVSSPLLRRAPDHVPGGDHDLRPALTLHPAASPSDDEHLPEWAPMPSRPRARLEGDERAAHAGTLDRLHERVYPNQAGEILLRPLLGRLRVIKYDFVVSLIARLGLRPMRHQSDS
jgi:hypothetical protein